MTDSFSFHPIMTYMQKPTLQQAMTLLRQNKMNDALNMIARVMEQERCAEYGDRLQMLREDYARMLSFMRQGFVDGQRPLLYGRLQQKTWQLIQDVELAWRMKNRLLYTEAATKLHGQVLSRELIRTVMEGYVADTAMLMLMPEDERRPHKQQLDTRHQDFMGRLFMALWTSPQWSADDQQFYTQLTLLPTIESRDAQLMVSAITIAIINIFDIRKFAFLVDVFSQATDERLRQRALIGWAFSLPKEGERFFPELQRTVKRLLADEAVRRELLELQIQVFWCMSAERDHAEIQRDIIPVILKNNDFNITRFGITEKEEDPLDDILHPDAEEQRMEAMETTINRMRDMQKEGADIYFGGFSQMKRFPFFNDMANWLMPYYADHPGLFPVKDELQGRQVPLAMLKHGSFCDSDKYSLSLAMASIFDRMPPAMREMMEAEHAADELAPTEEEQLSPAYIRRMYLQDLYRFYKLFPRRDDLVNVFVRKKAEDGKEGHLPSMFFFSELLREPVMDEAKLRLGKFLAKRGHWNNLLRLLGCFFMERALRPADYFMLEARLAMQRNRYGDANKSYQIVMQMDSNHVAAISGWARTSMLCHYYEDALTAYRLLQEKQPGSKSAELNECIALLKLDRADEAVEKLFRMNYDYPDDLNVKRVLAWGLMCQGKLEQADDIYKQLLAGDDAKVSPEDLLNAGYCQWFAGRVEQAVKLFSDYVWKLNMDNDLSVVWDMMEDAFSEDSTLIRSSGISNTEIRLMIDLIKSRK